MPYQTKRPEKKREISALEKVIMKKLQGSKKNIWMLEPKHS
ncbi:hypothetical protein [Sulfurimonas sp. HSL3-7]